MRAYPISDRIRILENEGSHEYIIMVNDHEISRHRTWTVAKDRADDYEKLRKIILKEQ